MSEAEQFYACVVGVIIGLIVAGPITYTKAVEILKGYRRSHEEKLDVIQRVHQETMNRHFADHRIALDQCAAKIEDLQRQLAAKRKFPEPF